MKLNRSIITIIAGVALLTCTMQTSSSSADTKPSTTLSKENPNQACLDSLFPASTNLKNKKINNTLCTKITNILIKETKNSLFANFAGNIAVGLFKVNADKTIIKNSELTNTIKRDQSIVLSKIMSPIDKLVKIENSITASEKEQYLKVINNYFTATLEVKDSDIQTMYTAVGTLKLTANKKNSNLIYTSTKDKSIIYTFDKNQKILTAILNKITYKYNKL